MNEKLISLANNEEEEEEEEEFDDMDSLNDYEYDQQDQYYDDQLDQEMLDDFYFDDPLQNENNFNINEEENDEEYSWIGENSVKPRIEFKRPV
eukprot:CAMPEP_0205802018 /NCGR_PEP_ID=MMETSP0205-20121125/4198_1 /ASSEMBLY_ACC=CAM_ASM_000278 /TAXON_ID=36767 /ORGANISM="Euplotes focardii, Strain TN1" /LENGTH=92 /DNA_ID=CAMNT_0053067729 /DNA_START=400 /DNA_END=678 /DNA_ORIENTATION=-